MGDTIEVPTGAATCCCAACPRTEADQTEADSKLHRNVDSPDYHCRLLRLDSEGGQEDTPAEAGKLS